jgi:hypothetical protein
MILWRELELEMKLQNGPVGTPRQKKILFYWLKHKNTIDIWDVTLNQG